MRKASHGKKNKTPNRSAKRAGRTDLRKRAKEALRESETRYHTLFDASTDAIFVETLEGKVLDCNAAACEMLGYSKAELTALSVTDLVPEQVAQTLPAVITKELTTGGIFVESSNKRKNGSVFPCEVSTRVVTLDGEPRVIAYVRDISERRRAEKEMQQRLNELAAVNAISQAATSQLELNALLEIVADRLLQIFDIQGISDSTVFCGHLR
jgi:PAS domain S-box-containing protein